MITYRVPNKLEPGSRYWSNLISRGQKVVFSKERVHRYPNTVLCDCDFKISYSFTLFSKGGVTLLLLNTIFCSTRLSSLAVYD